jgi:hypothetical protein
MKRGRRPRTLTEQGTRREGTGDMKRTLTTGIATAALVSAGLGCAAVELAAGTAHAGANRWCPGDPPPRVSAKAPNGNTISVPVHPAWDLNVCHDWVATDGHVMEGIPCILPSFQQFMCPPGTTPNQLMTPVPNIGEG